MISHSDYIAGIIYLTKRDPQHPLLEDIQREYNLINCKYLESALASLPPEQKVEENQVPATDSNMIHLQDQLSKLYTERAKQSNSFHNVATDADRSIIVDNIAHIQGQIKETMQAIAHYQTTGKVADKPEALKQQKYPVPTCKLAAYKLSRSKKNTLSKRKKALQIAMQKDAQSDRCKQLSNEIDELDAYIQILESAIE